MVGDRIELHGFAQDPRHNGRTGTIVALEPDNDNDWLYATMDDELEDGHGYMLLTSDVCRVIDAASIPVEKETNNEQPDSRVPRKKRGNSNP